MYTQQHAQPPAFGVDKKGNASKYLHDSKNMKGRGGANKTQEFNLLL
jgi:hypothetical protein